MKVTRVEIKGRTGIAAHLTRVNNADGIEPMGQYIEVEIRSHNDLIARHHVLADDRDDLFSMAQCLQHQLDGYSGTNSEIHEYFRILEMMAD